ncbi:MAG: helix-turn-helix transcriptional regulator [Alphaproteobacteria bacterium]|nr:helix-turn-helix transcriptional regulator [Alphaproteobacteria bacterium]
MKEIPFIVSLAQKETTNSICHNRFNIGKIKYISMYIIFSNKRKFILSNIYDILIPFYMNSLYLGDYHSHPDVINGKEYYLVESTNCSSLELTNLLENKFNVFRTYYIIRRCPECIFAFGAVHDHKIEQPEIFYQTTMDKFQYFCLDFVRKNIDLIKEYNPEYKRSIILNDIHYLKLVITNSYKPTSHRLTDREFECLFWAARGKTAFETACILNISQRTVEHYIKSITSKLGCSNIKQAIYESIIYDQLSMNNLRNYHYIEPHYDKKFEISESNLSMLNQNSM